MRGPIITQEDFDRRVEYLAGMLHARADVIACGVPLLALVVAGCQPESVHPVVVVACLVGELACVIWFNPWRCLDKCLAPLSRTLLLLSILLMALAAVMAVMDAPVVAVVLVLLAVASCAVALWRRKAWLLSWQTKQSPEVDKALAHLDKGGEWEPGTAWERDGCRQTRAMLHQALDMECNEAELSRAYKAVYLLAFLCGLKERENEVERLKKERDKAKAEADKWRGVAVVREDNAAELDYVKGQLDETRAALTAAQDRARQYSKELEAWKPQEAEGSTEAQVIAYHAAGHSLQETADRFGMSKTGVHRLVKQAETLVEDGASGGK
ncbi:MAG: hypothetical protein LUC47_11100 [Clostridiales bacterium]|nr:hypothetical protein [Clostridiales bacterium]